MQHLRKQLYLLEEGGPTGAGVRVAVLDTGVDLGHPDLRDRVRTDLSAALTYESSRDDLVDRNGHGTHIASIIGGTGASTPSKVFRGIAPECELVVYKTLHHRKGLEGNAVAAIQLAIEAGADIINYSHGYAPSSKGVGPWLWPAEFSLLEEAFTVAAERGILCVVAAGNLGPFPGTITRPGGLATVLTVGAVDPSGGILTNSSRGPFRRSPDVRPGGARGYEPELDHQVTVVPKPDVVAPGTIVAARAQGCFRALDELGDELGEDDPTYVSLSGTSQATAVVSGLAALLLQEVRRQDIELGENRVRTLMRIIRHAGARMTNLDECDVGSGLVQWPQMIATLSDYANDPQFRATVLGDGLLLL